MRRTVVFLPTLSVFYPMYPKCQKKRNRKKLKCMQRVRRFICTSILPSTTVGGALYGDCNPSCTPLTALQCNPRTCRQLPCPRTGTSQDQDSQDDQESQDSDLDSDFYCDSRQVLLTAILCWKMSFRAYQRLTSDRSQPKNNGQDGHTERKRVKKNKSEEWFENIVIEKG